MIPYPVYKLVHFLGIFSVLIALALMCAHVLRGGTRADYPYRKQTGAVHGIGMLLILVGGFGMLARLGFHGLPGWIIAKLVIWLFIGASAGLAFRGASIARVLLILLPFIGVLAAFFALYKPF